MALQDLELEPWPCRTEGCAKLWRYFPFYPCNCAVMQQELSLSLMSIAGSTRGKHCHFFASSQGSLSDFLASFQGNETTRAAAAHSQGACAGDGNPSQLCSLGWRCKVSVADGHHSHHYTPNQTLCGVAEGVLQPMVVSPP